MSNAVVRIDPASRESWSPEFDEGPHPRAQIGQIGYVLVANVDLSEAGFFGMKPGPAAQARESQHSKERQCQEATHQHPWWERISSTW